MLAKDGVRLLLDGHPQEASEKFNRALQLRVDKSYFHFLNAVSYHLRGKAGDRQALDLAEQGYTLAIQFDQTNWMAYYYLGRLYIDLGQYDKASTRLAEALMFNPRDEEVLRAFAFACYRSGRPDLAAGAFDALDKAGALTPLGLRNAAVTMAALNDTERARSYFERLRQSGAPVQQVAYVRQRLDDWGTFHLAQYNSSSSGSGGYGSSSGSGSGTDAASQPPPETVPGTEDKMVVIDVIIIGTEENITTSRGVNLMSGLTLQFGSPTSPAYSLVKSFSTTDGSTPTQANTTTVTRALTVPAITYSLNILNSNNTRNEVLARPTLIGLAGKPSEFFSGVQLNAAAVATGTTGGNSVNIDKEIGVKLTVTPAFLQDGRLRMLVTAERTFLQTPSGDVQFSLKIQTTKNKVTANIVMRYGETLILGGLSEKEADMTRDGVPGLQDVPLLQYLFSKNTTTDYQKSVLILLTPRPPQYVYQPDKARQEYEKSLSEDERPIATLRSRYADWFKPYPNWASVFHHLQENGLYREFRTGDVDLESWSDLRALHDRLNQALDFLHY
jgi:tetratricopeptide (TPR) repeat protein